MRQRAATPARTSRCRTDPRFCIGSLFGEGKAGCGSVRIGREGLIDRNARLPRMGALGSDDLKC